MAPFCEAIRRSALGGASFHCAWLGQTELPARGRLVQFDVTVERLIVVLGHELGPDHLEHPVRCLIGHAELSLELLGGNATPSARHEINGVEPQVQAGGGLVKDRPRCRVHVKATGRARPALALLLRLVPLERRLSLATATEGVRAVLGVPLAPQPLQARLVVGEVAQEVAERVLGVRRSDRVGDSRGSQVPSQSSLIHWTYTVKVQALSED